jgi:hypothetical protein
MPKYNVSCFQAWNSHCTLQWWTFLIVYSWTIFHPTRSLHSTLQFQIPVCFIIFWCTAFRVIDSRMERGEHTQRQLTSWLIIPGLTYYRFMLIAVLAIISESGFVNTIWPADCLPLSLMCVCAQAAVRGRLPTFIIYEREKPAAERLCFAPVVCTILIRC